LEGRKEAAFLLFEREKTDRPEIIIEEGEKVS